jgi:hypothetical protein
VDLIEKHSWLNISEDLDGHYYLDKWLDKMEPEKHHLEKIKNKISIQIDDLGVNPNLSVLSKYKWVLNKIIERERTDLRKNRT